MKDKGYMNPNRPLLVLTLFVLLFVPMVGADDWPMYGHDPQHTGISKDVLEPPLILTNNYTLNFDDHQYGREFSIRNDVLYIGTYGCKCDYSFLYAINVNNGKIIWKYKVDGDSCEHSSPAIDENYLFFISSDGISKDYGHIYALDIYNGDLIWKFNAKGAFKSSPTLDGDTIYIGSEYPYDYHENSHKNKGRLYALNKNTGDLKWKFDAGWYIESSPAIDEEFIFFGTDEGENSYFYTLDKINGNVVWKHKICAAIESSPVISADFVYFGANDNFLYALNKSNGDLKWKYKLDSEIDYPPVIDGGLLVIGTPLRHSVVVSVGNMDVGESREIVSWSSNNGLKFDEGAIREEHYEGGSLYTFNKQSGDLIWNVSKNFSISSSPIVSGNYIYLSSGTKTYAFDKYTGSLKWEHEIGVSNSYQILISENKLFKISSTGLYIFRHDFAYTLERIEDAVSALKVKGINTVQFETLLAQAIGTLAKGEYEETSTLVEQAKAKIIEANNVSIYIANARKMLSYEKSKGFNIAKSESLLSQAEQAFNAGDYVKAKELTTKAKSLAIDIDQDGAPNDADFAPATKNHLIYAGAAIFLLVAAFMTKVSIGKMRERERIRREGERRRLEYEQKIREHKAQLERWEREGYDVSALRERWFK